MIPVGINFSDKDFIKFCCKRSGRCEWFQIEVDARQSYPFSTSVFLICAYIMSEKSTKQERRIHANFKLNNYFLTAICTDETITFSFSDANQMSMFYIKKYLRIILFVVFFALCTFWCFQRIQGKQN